MPPREPDQIPLQDISFVPHDLPTTTPPGTAGGFTPHPGHPDHISALRTFSSDLADAVRKQQGSVIKIAIAEDEKRRRESYEASPASRKNTAFIVGAIALFLIPLSIIVGTVWYKKNSTLPAPVADVVPPSLIPAEGAGTIDISGKNAGEIVSKIRAVAADPVLRSGTVRNIIPVNSVSGTEISVPIKTFLSMLEMHAPTDFARSLSNDSMLGVYRASNANIFLVLRGTAHDYMLSGMLAWEETLLPDMAPLFGISAPDPSAHFQDALIQNRDTRAVLGESAAPVLFYSFLDPNTVIIAADPGTLVEAVRRFGR